MAKKNRYEQIMERIFLSKFKKGDTQVQFERKEIIQVASELGIELPKNLGDVVYSFRYRSDLPKEIGKRAPKGKNWIIRPTGRARYCFVATGLTDVVPNGSLTETKIPNATPGVIEMYALSDEQALLAKIRYNRLIDIFTGVTCYSLQSHLRTSVPDMGQVETDELYVGVDRKGLHYIFPVQAKGHKDRLNIVQIEQDFALCAKKFPSLICRPIAAQFMENDLISLFEFETDSKGAAIALERHYRLVPSEEFSDEDLTRYKQRLDNS
ncbi:MAG: hypothetical protein JW810_00750 [Sedimentisphaerales bacterium]|nr:hypothetical protein [Sedimentisphaerales bacterium]